MKTMNQKAQAGFTLIELMIVVAIIGILAAVAIPQYSAYTTKAKLANAITVADSLKSAVALCVQETGDAANCDENTNGIPANTAFQATKEVQSVGVANGAITLTFAAAGISTDVNGKTVTFTPVPGATSINWTIATNITNTTFAEALTKNSAPAAATTPSNPT